MNIPTSDNQSNFKCVVDFEKIPQKKVRTLLQSEQLFTVEAFAKLKAICYQKEDPLPYRTHFKAFLVKKDPTIVWKTYTTIAPSETWKGKMVTFGCQYDRQQGKITYLEDDFDGLAAGQLLFMNLRLLGGLINIAVSHEIMEVNEPEKFIKICYLEKGASIGTQLLTFTSTAEGFTRIEHQTIYRSNSTFRDKILYPTLHGKAIAEFHENIRKKMELDFCDDFK